MKELIDDYIELGSKLKFLHEATDAKQIRELKLAKANTTQDILDACPDRATFHSTIEQAQAKIAEVTQ